MGDRRLPIVIGACRVNRVAVHIKSFSNPAGKRVEFHVLEETDQGHRIWVAQTKCLHTLRDGHVLSKGHQLAGNTCLVCEFNQVLPTFGLFDFFSTRQQRIHVAIFIDQQCGGLHTNTGNTRNIVGAVASKRLYVDHLVGADPELLFHFCRANGAVLHCVEHVDIVPNHLHKVFV